MDADQKRWSQIKRIFTAALDAPPDSLDEFLEASCGHDDGLAAEVRSLLDSHRKAGDFLEREALPQFSVKEKSEFVEDLSGRRMGSYRLLRRIGQGGMGAVYLAERVDGTFQKQVAVKLVRAGSDKGLIARRLQRERQILARLEHPSIARLLDGGTTEQGWPYYAMEYVDGVSIDEYCRNNRLSIRERIGLFVKVCSAVQYAHQNLVIHRDLKPGNILVDKDGRPRLLDFGIAKLLAPDEDLQTVTFIRSMTMRYASPEQIRCQPVSTSADVYALGVVLYELLTECSPYRVVDTSPHELGRVICEEEPEPPSRVLLQRRAGEKGSKIQADAVSATHFKDGDASRVSRLLRGDLDNIVLTALRKEPRRRYASVEQLSADLDRYLKGLPVTAGKDSLAYRAGKFVRRHLTGVAAAGLILLALLAGAVSTAWQAHVAEIERARAERRFNDVRSLANSLLFELNDAIEDLPGSTHARQLLIERALKYLNSLSGESNNDEGLRRELAAAYERVGQIQGSPYLPNLGDTKGALESLQKALKLRRELLASKPGKPELSEELAGCLDHLADLDYSLGRTSQALRHYREVLSLRSQVSAARPSDDASRRNLAVSHGMVGDVLLSIGKVEEGLKQLRQARAIFEWLAKKNPGLSSPRMDLAMAFDKIGDAESERGRLEEALERYQKSLAIRKEVASSASASRSVQRSLAISYGKVSDALLALHRPAACLTNARRSLEISRALSQADQADQLALRDVSIAYTREGDALLDLKQPARARRSFEKSLEIDSKLASQDPGNSLAQEDLSISYDRIGDLAVKSDPREALGYYRKSLAIRKELFSQDPVNRHYSSDVATSLLKLGEAYRDWAAGTREPALKRRRLCTDSLGWLRKSVKTWSGVPAASESSDASFREAKKVLAEVQGKCPAGNF